MVDWVKRLQADMYWNCLNTLKSKSTQSSAMKVRLVMLVRTFSRRSSRNRLFTTLLTAWLEVRADIEMREQTRALEFNTMRREKCYLSVPGVLTCKEGGEVCQHGWSSSTGK